MRDLSSQNRRSCFLRDKLAFFAATEGVRDSLRGPRGVFLGCCVSTPISRILGAMVSTQGRGFAKTKDASVYVGQWDLVTVAEG